MSRSLSRAAERTKSRKLGTTGSTVASASASTSTTVT